MKAATLFALWVPVVGGAWAGPVDDVSSDVSPAAPQPERVGANALLAQTSDVMDQFYQVSSGAGEQGDRITVESSTSALTDWDDPTEEDYYREYPEEEPLPDEMSQSLGSIAQEMEPGEWRRLPDAKYLGQAKWADKAEWDPARQRISYLGHHGRPRPTRWVMWDLDEGRWYRQVGDQFHPKTGIHNRWGYRSYGKYTQLADGSNVYSRFQRLWKQDPETLEWKAWTMHPCYQMIGNIEYFPEMDAVVSLGKGREFCAYYVDDDEWRNLPRPRVEGRHSMMRYNPVRGEVLLLGGDKSWRDAQILNADGELRDVADAPRNTRIRTDMLTVDPVSGHWLLMAYESKDEPEKTWHEVDFFGYDPDADTWYQIDRWTRDATWNENDPPSWPFTSKHARPVAVALPEYGVTMWIESTHPGVHLYKHDAPASADGE